MKNIFLILSLFLSFNLFANVVLFNPGDKIKHDEINNNFNKIGKKALIQLEKDNAHGPSSYLDVVWTGNSFANKISHTPGSANFTFNETGIYKISVSMRNITDVWTRITVLDEDNNVKGQSTEIGGSPAGSSVTFLFEVTDISKSHKVNIAAPVSGNAFVDDPVSPTAKSIVAVIHKMD